METRRNNQNNQTNKNNNSIRTTKKLTFVLCGVIMSSVFANAQFLNSILKGAEKAAMKEAIEAGIKGAEKATVKEATESVAKAIVKDGTTIVIKQVKTFEPYVGKNYAKGINGKKVMTLGESHYCSDPKQAVPGFTKDRIAEYKKYLEGKISIRDDNGWMQTYNNWLNTLAGRNLSKAEKLKLIEDVSFYNYVQVPMKGPRVRPTAADWKCSSEAFIQEIVAEKPDVIIAWGDILYQNLPKTLGQRGKDIILSNGKRIETWVYSIDGHSTVVVRTNHPASVGYDAKLWNEVIQQSLA